MWRKSLSGAAGECEAFGSYAGESELEEEMIVSYMRYTVLNFMYSIWLSHGFAVYCT